MQRRVCYAARTKEWGKAAYSDLHEKSPWHDGAYGSWSKNQSAEHPHHAMHGVTFSVALDDADPGDNFTADPHARPSELRPTEQPQQHHDPEEDHDGGTS